MNIITEAKSTKVLYDKEELDELYQYPNLIVYIKSKKGVLLLISYTEIELLQFLFIIGSCCDIIDR